MSRKNIKVQADEFEELERDKPDGVSWGYYLTEIRTTGEGHICNGCGDEYDRDEDGANIHYCPVCRKMREESSRVE